MKKNRTIVFLLVVFLLLIVVFVKMLSTDNKSDEKKQHEVKTENTEVIKKNEPSIQANSGSKTENSPNRVNVPENKNPNQSIQFENRKSTVSDPNTDLDGDSFVGTKDKCPNEYGDINGCPDTDGDGVPDYKDKCGDKPGPASNNGCPKPITISVDLALSSQNNFTWNSKVAEEGLKATLVFQTNSGAEFRKDVTGLSSFKFKSGDTRFDGVMTNVELLITTNEGVKVTGTTKIKTRTTC